MQQNFYVGNSIHFQVWDFLHYQKKAAGSEQSLTLRFDKSPWAYFRWLKVGW